MTRQEALQLLGKYITNKNLLKHMLACEAVMARLAQHFNEDSQKWALAGLLHDIDYDETKDDLARHSLIGAEILSENGLDSEIIQAVKTHNAHHGIPRETLMDKALYATDPLTGLIVAGALIKPEKKLSAVDVGFLLNRFQEKGFARGANRQQIQACSDLGLSLEEFLSFGLAAMNGISGELGL